MLSLILAAVGVVAGPCVLPVPSNADCVQWVAPTTFTDTTPINHPLRYRVYRKIGTNYQSPSDVTALGATFTGLPLGQQCFGVTAVDTVTLTESAIADVGCKLLKLPAPSDGSIEAPTNGSIEPPK